MSEEIKNPAESDLSLFFENFIKTGIVTKEREIVPGFKVKLKVLNIGELMSAETISFQMNSDFPVDVVLKLRSASVLSQAILSVNGIEILKDSNTKQENRSRQNLLYRQLLDMPAYVIQKTYELYIEAVEEQNNIYKTANSVGDKIENF